VFSPRVFGDQQRIITWKIAARVFGEHPFFGVGPEGFQRAFTAYRPPEFGHEVAANAHNDILHAGATLGIVGLAAYLFLAYSAFSVLRGPAFGAIAALFVNAKVSPVPLEALVLAAVIIGGYSIRPSSPKPLTIYGRILFAAIGLSACNLIARVVMVG